MDTDIVEHAQRVVAQKILLYSVDCNQNASKCSQHIISAEVMKKTFPNSSSDVHNFTTAVHRILLCRPICRYDHEESIIYGAIGPTVHGSVHDANNILPENIFDIEPSKKESDSVIGIMVFFSLNNAESVKRMHDFIEVHLLSHPKIPNDLSVLLVGCTDNSSKNSCELTLLPDGNQICISDIITMKRKKNVATQGSTILDYAKDIGARYATINYRTNRGFCLNVAFELALFLSEAHESEKFVHPYVTLKAAKNH